ncbi:MAG: histidine phosphatase family protein [Anaerolineaceae bacterium]|nr:histidine phosphatase family protein [Anaerolineaceae bacterium]
MTEILIIRHGENDFMAKRLPGRLPDVHLNAKGIIQSYKIAHFLSDLPIKALYCSPMERTIETIEPFAKLKGMEIRVAPELNEIDYGIWQGKRYETLMTKKLWRQIRKAPSEVTLPEGESFLDAQQRVVSFFDGLSETHTKNELVVCVTHADVIRLAVAHYLGMCPDHFQRLSIGVATMTKLFLHKGKAGFGPIGQPITY